MPRLARAPVLDFTGSSDGGDGRFPCGGNGEDESCAPGSQGCEDDAQKSADLSGFPQRAREFPPIPDSFPGLPDGFPRLRGRLPALPGRFPVFPDRLPALPGRFPVFPDRLPGLLDGFPGFLGGLPGLPGDFPPTLEGRPRFLERFPRKTEGGTAGENGPAEGADGKAARLRRGPSLPNPSLLPVLRPAILPPSPGERGCKTTFFQTNSDKPLPLLPVRAGGRDREKRAG